MASGVKTIKKKAAPRPRFRSPITPHFDFEREAFASGHRWVAGVDEVGARPAGRAGRRGGGHSRSRRSARGAQRVEGAPGGPRRRSLCEKSSSPKRIERLGRLRQRPGEIDLFNIRGAALRAMARAVAALSVRPHFVLIDGRDLPDGLICPARPIIDGDARSMSIAAASIVAKTMRDALMRNIGLEYPQYGFARARRLRDGWTPQGAGFRGPLPLSPTLVPELEATTRMTSRPKRFQKG